MYCCITTIVVDRSPGRPTHSNGHRFGIGLASGGHHHPPKPGRNNGQKANQYDMGRPLTIIVEKPSKTHSDGRPADSVLGPRGTDSTSNQYSNSEYTLSTKVPLNTKSASSYIHVTNLVQKCMQRQRVA